MANTSKGLGKGLGALMGDDMMALHEEKTSLMLPISQVESCAAQPRKLFDPDALAITRSLRASADGAPPAWRG